MKVAWLCPYPVSLLPEEKVSYNKSKVFHPATWIVNLSGALSKERDVELHIITETPWINKDYRFEHNKIHFHILRRPYSVPLMRRGLPSWLPLGPLSKYYFDEIIIRREIYSIKPDLIHTHGTEAQYSYVACKMKIPVLISMQGIVGYLKNFQKGKKRPFQDKLEIETIKNSKYFISRAKFSDEYIFGHNKHAIIHKIDDFVNEDFFRVNRMPEENSLLFVGSVVKTKGVEELLMAFNNLTKKYEALNLRMAGSFEPKYRNYLMEKFIRADSYSTINFLGQLSKEELIEEYKKAEIFVFPSYFETSPNVIMEAMSVGLPIIATNAGGIPDMVEEGKTGILINCKSPDELSQSVEFLLNHKDYANKIGMNAKKLAESKFRRDVILKKTLNLYNKILSAN